MGWGERDFEILTFGVSPLSIYLHLTRRVFYSSCCYCERALVVVVIMVVFILIVYKKPQMWCSAAGAMKQ